VYYHYAQFAQIITHSRFVTPFVLSLHFYVPWKSHLLPINKLNVSDLKGKGSWRKMDMAHIFRVSPVEVCKRDTMERVSATSLTTAAFIERYEKIYKPVVITDVQTDWPAREKWTLPV